MRVMEGFPAGRDKEADDVANGSRLLPRDGLSDTIPDVLRSPTARAERRKYEEGNAYFATRISIWLLRIRHTFILRLQAAGMASTQNENCAAFGLRSVSSSSIILRGRLSQTTGGRAIPVILSRNKLVSKFISIQ